MFKICFYSPLSSVEEIKKALFKIGVGKYKNYDSCSWQSNGQGQFRPLDGSNPHIGSHHHIEKIEECKVEMICSEELIHQAVKTLIATHPYEEPSYQIIRILTINDFKE